MKKFARIALPVMICFCALAVAAEPNTAELKNSAELFHTVNELENAMPFKKANVERLTGCKLEVDKSPHHFEGTQDRQEFFSEKSTDKLVAQIELTEALQPDKNFQGIVIILTNKIRNYVSEADVRSAYGKPDEISDALNMCIPESGQLKSLMYRKKWGLLIFSVSKSKEHDLKEVVLQAIVQPPLIPAYNGR